MLGEQSDDIAHSLQHTHTHTHQGRIRHCDLIMGVDLRVALHLNPKHVPRSRICIGYILGSIPTALDFALDNVYADSNNTGALAFTSGVEYVSTSHRS